MNSYLKALLAELHTLIIPGLGALTITNAERGEILFMPYLKYDDGKLAQHISDKEGMSLNDAKNLIAKYVREIEQIIQKGERYDMYQFGSFSKDDAGEIQFTAWNLMHANTEFANLSDNITLPEHEEDLNTKGDNSSLTPEYIEEENLPEELMLSTQLNETVQIKSDKTKETFDENQTANYTIEEQWNDDLDIPPIGYNKPLRKQPILEKTKKDHVKQSKTLPILLFSIVLLGSIGGILFYQTTKQKEKRLSFAEYKTIRNKSKQQQLVQANSKKVDELNTAVKQTAHPDTIKQVQQTKPIVSQPKENGLLAKGNYHIIGNAFRKKSNAERYCKKLNDTGKSAELLCKLGGLYHVKINSFENKIQAQKELNSYRGISKGAWIMYLKR